MQTEKMSPYFSFPACLEANLVYQRATLKAMETSSKMASCWALAGETVGYTGSRSMIGTITKNTSSSSFAQNAFQESIIFAALCKNE